MALNNYRQTGGGGFAMLRDAPVVYDQQQEIRQLLIDEVQRKGTLLPADYFHPNWRIVPASAIGGLLKISVKQDDPNGSRVRQRRRRSRCPQASTALDAVRAWNAAAAGEVTGGAR